MGRRAVPSVVSDQGPHGARRACQAPAPARDSEDLAGRADRFAAVGPDPAERLGADPRQPALDAGSRAEGPFARFGGDSGARGQGQVHPGLARRRSRGHTITPPFSFQAARTWCVVPPVATAFRLLWGARAESEAKRG